jgi:hypothetical protein
MLTGYTPPRSAVGERLALVHLAAMQAEALACYAEGDAETAEEILREVILDSSLMAARAAVQHARAERGSASADAREVGTFEALTLGLVDFRTTIGVDHGSPAGDRSAFFTWFDEPPPDGSSPVFRGVHVK